jgi:rod shape-determining protein MreD
VERIGIVLVALVAVVAQTTLIPVLTVTGVAPDLVFLLVVFFALQRGTTLGLWMGFSLGVLQDVAGGGPLGLNGLILLGVAYLVGRLRTRLFKENLPAQILIVLILTWFHQFLMFFCMNTVLEAEFTVRDWLHRSLIMGLYHALIGPLLYRWLATWIQGDDVYRHLIAGDAQSRRKVLKRFV